MKPVIKLNFYVPATRLLYDYSVHKCIIIKAASHYSIKRMVVTLWIDKSLTLRVQWLMFILQALYLKRSWLHKGFCQNCSTQERARKEHSFLGAKFFCCLHGWILTNQYWINCSPIVYRQKGGRIPAWFLTSQEAGRIPGSILPLSCVGNLGKSPKWIQQLLVLSLRSSVL